MNRPRPTLYDLYTYAYLVIREHRETIAEVLTLIFAAIVFILLLVVV
jgi:hypothetical protein